MAFSPHREQRDEPLVVAVLRHEPEARPHRGRHVTRPDPAAVDRDRAGVGLAQPDQRLGQADLAAARGSGQADDLTRLNGNINI
ncbi:hypothetical protein GCM10020216_051570 [Nonomuraea helvata]